MDDSDSDVSDIEATKKIDSEDEDNPSAAGLSNKRNKVTQRRRGDDDRGKNHEEHDDDKDDDFDHDNFME